MWVLPRSKHTVHLCHSFPEGRDTLSLLRIRQSGARRGSERSRLTGFFASKLRRSASMMSTTLGTCGSGTGLFAFGRSLNQHIGELHFLVVDQVLMRLPNPSTRVVNNTGNKLSVPDEENVWGRRTRTVSDFHAVVDKPVSTPSSLHDVFSYPRPECVLARG
jgi:hypothetical protein